MEENNELDLGYLWNVLKKHAVVICLVSFICAAAAYFFTDYCIEKKYESKALLYVENNNKSNESVNINDITAAQKLVNTCQILFKSNTVLTKLIDELDLIYDKETLNEMITARSVNSTEVLELSVESADPMEAQKIVNKLVEIAEDEFSRVIKSGSIEVFIGYKRRNVLNRFEETLQTVSERKNRNLRKGMNAIGDFYFCRNFILKKSEKTLVKLFTKEKIFDIIDKQVYGDVAQMVRALP